MNKNTLPISNDDIRQFNPIEIVINISVETTRVNFENNLCKILAEQAAKELKNLIKETDVSVEKTKNEYIRDGVFVNGDVEIVAMRKDDFYKLLKFIHTKGISEQFVKSAPLNIEEEKSRQP